MSHECPHCQDCTIGNFDKVVSTKDAPVTCSNCGGKSYIERTSAIVWIALITTFAGLFLWPVLEFGIVILLVCIVAYFLVGLHLMAKFVPLIVLGDSGARKDH